MTTTTEISRKETTMSTYESTHGYAEYIYDQGFITTVTQPGCIRFEYGSRVYFLMLKDEDDRYVQISRHLWQASTPEEKQCAAEAARTIAQTYTSAKICVKGRNVSAVVEATLPSRDAFFERFNELMYPLENEVIINKFVHIMRASLSKPPVKPFPVTRALRAEAYRDHLLSKGYQAQLDEHDSVIFEVDGHKYVLSLDDMYDKMIRIWCIGITKIRHYSDRDRASAIYRDVTKKIPKVDLWINSDGDVSAFATVALYDPLVLDEEFDKRFKDMNAAIETFTQKLREAKIETE